MDSTPHKVRKVSSKGTTSYQYGRYEMTGDKGKRRSMFKVNVHLGEHQTPDAALASWPMEIQHLRSIGRENKADRLESKLTKLSELVES